MSIQLITGQDMRNGFNINSDIDRAILKKRMESVMVSPFLNYDIQGPLIGMPGSIQNIQNCVRLEPQVHDGIVSRKLRFDHERGIQNMRKVQNMMTGTDFPEFLTNLFLEIEKREPFDTEWTWFYDYRTLDAAGYDEFIRENNVVTHRTPPGERVKYYGASGTKYRIYTLYYSTGIAMDRRLVLDQDWLNLGKILMAQRDASDRKRAEIAYALIEAIPAARDVAWANPDPSGMAVTDSNYTLSRDAETLNAAGVQLVEENKNNPDVMPAMANTVFHVLVPHQLKKRITRAINYKLQPFAESTNAVDYTFEVHATTMLTSTTEYYVAIPKGRNTGGSRLMFTNYDEFNKDIFADEKAAWESYVFNIGDTGQWKRCKTTT